MKLVELLATYNFNENPIIFIDLIDGKEKTELSFNFGLECDAWGKGSRLTKLKTILTPTILESELCAFQKDEETNELFLYIERGKEK